jgi:hypothetical protein
LQTALAGRAPWFAGFARLGNYGGLQDHVPKFLQAIFLVSFLIAKSLRGDDQIVVGGDSISLLGAEARFDFLG